MTNFCCSGVRSKKELHTVRQWKKKINVALHQIVVVAFNGKLFLTHKFQLTLHLRSLATISYHSTSYETSLYHFECISRALKLIEILQNINELYLDQNLCSLHASCTLNCFPLNWPFSKVKFTELIHLKHRGKH